MEDRPELHINVGEAKKSFSDLLARVAYGGETIVITRRGRPMARLVPPGRTRDDEHVASVRGWLSDEDPYFELVDHIVAARSRHLPRVLSGGKRRSRSRKK